MNVDTSIWGKLKRVVIGLFAIAVLLLVAIWYLPLIKQNQRMRTEIMRLDTELEKKNEENKQLKAAVDALNDPKVVERLAREKLGYARPGETVVRFEAALTNQPPPRQTN
jgi:cell division protein FtsL